MYKQVTKFFVVISFVIFTSSALALNSPSELDYQINGNSLLLSWGWSFDEGDTIGDPVNPPYSSYTFPTPPCDPACTVPGGLDIQFDVQVSINGTNYTTIASGIDDKTFTYTFSSVLPAKFRVRALTVNPYTDDYTYSEYTTKTITPVSQPPVSPQPVADDDFALQTTTAPANKSFFEVSAPSVDNIGTIQGQAGVSGGAATYHIPIELPPGRADMQPNVSLNYSSRSGNGIAGIGWSLSAGSSITRCAATFAQDGFTQNPQYNSNDRLCLDGQRLIATSGTYGNSGTQYRTEIDSFVRVTQSGSLNGSSTWFKVEYKNGRVGYFGKEAKSRLVHGGKTAAYSWLIQYQHDATAKNYIHYEYEQFGVGEKLLTDIYYTGNSSSTFGQQHVSLNYDDRTDKRISYLAGGKYSATQTISHIRLLSSGDREVMIYQFDYITSQASSRDLLASITLCFNNNCFRPTTFNWQDKGIKFEIEPLGYVKNNQFYQQYKDKRYLESVIPHGDTNGDGIRDFADYYVNAQGEYVGEPSSTLDPCVIQQSTLGLNCVDLDINLDGISDQWFSENEQLKFKLSTGETINTNISLFQPGIAEGNDIVKFANDFNGDGWVDIVISAPFGNGQQTTLTIYFHSQNMSQPYNTNNAYNLGSELLLDKIISGGRKKGRSQIALVGDIDGNGLADFALLENWSVREVNTHANGILSTNIAELIVKNLFLNMSTEGAPRFITHSLKGFFQDNAYTIFGDINGDGLSDLLDVRNGKLRVNHSLVLKEGRLCDSLF